jgi:hypothetical protein
VPYPFAHPAAVLPLVRPMGRLGVTSALVIGSMVPDAWYLVPGLVRADSHSFEGLFWFCLPVGFVLYLLWTGSRPRASAAAVAVSLLAGAATHLAWDGLTHSYSYQGFYVLQHASTVLGSAFIVWWCTRSGRLALATGALLAAAGIALLLGAENIAALRSALRETAVLLGWIAGASFVAWRLLSR